MNSYFTDSMIIQQNQPINIFGKSEKGVLIEVSLFKRKPVNQSNQQKLLLMKMGIGKLYFLQ